MEEVFDLRKFLLLLWKKGKMFLIFAVAFALLGGAFGFITGNDNSYVSTSSASVNTTNDKTDATALTSIMSSIKDTISSDFFYTGILTEIGKKMPQEDISTLFDTSKQPSITKLKEVITVYVKGNLVLVDVIGEKELAQKVSTIARQFAMDRLEQNINDIDIVERDQQTISKSLQTGATRKKEAIKFAILGFAGGIVLCVLWIFLFDVMSLKVKSATELKKYKLPVFAYDEESLKAVASKMILSLLSNLSSSLPMPYSIAICTSSSTLQNNSDLMNLSKALCVAAEENGLSSAVCKNIPLKFSDASEYKDKCENNSDISIFPISDMNEQAAMLACCEGVLLLENCETSRIDKIEDALETIGNARKVQLGFAFYGKGTKK